MVKTMSENAPFVNCSVGSEPKLGSAWLGFGSSFWTKKARLGSAYLAKKARFSSACSMIKKPSHLKKQKMS